MWAGHFVPPLSRALLARLCSAKCICPTSYAPQPAAQSSGRSSSRDGRATHPRASRDDRLAGLHPGRGRRAQAGQLQRARAQEVAVREGQGRRREKGPRRRCAPSCPALHLERTADPMLGSAEEEAAKAYEEFVAAFGVEDEAPVAGAGRGRGGPPQRSAGKGFVRAGGGGYNPLKDMELAAPPPPPPVAGPSRTRPSADRKSVV